MVILNFIASKKIRKRDGARNVAKTIIIIGLCVRRRFGAEHKTIKQSALMGALSKKEIRKMKKKHYVKDLSKTNQYKYGRNIEVPYYFKLAVNKGLTDVQTLLLSIIYRYSQMKDGCYKSTIQTLRVMLNCSASTIIRALDVLLERKLLIKDVSGELPTYKVNIDLTGEPFIIYHTKNAVKYGLSTTEAIIFSIITHYSSLKFKCFTGKSKALEVMLNCSRSTVKRALRTLLEKQLIYIVPGPANKRYYSSTCAPIVFESANTTKKENVTSTQSEHKFNEEELDNALEAIIG